MIVIPLPAGGCQEGPPNPLVWNSIFLTPSGRVQRVLLKARTNDATSSLLRFGVDARGASVGKAETSAISASLSSGSSERTPSSTSERSHD